MRARLLPLGSGRIRDTSIGGKAGLLDRAAEAGLPVPQGVVLPEETLVDLQQSGRISFAGDTVEVSDETQLLASLALPAFAGPVAIRSAFSAEDGASRSLAGHFESCLNVATHDPSAVATALTEVWNSAGRHSPLPRRDVLVMQMVDAQHAGVAFTERNFEDDRVEFVSGTADALVSGALPGSSLELAKLRTLERSHAEPGWPRRLQRLLRSIRREFGEHDWDIEWADDGTRAWLIQIRPITAAPRRNELFTNANFKEILPDPPSRFMASVVESSSTGFYEYYRGFDPSLPEGRSMIELFDGRPYFNLSLLRDTLRAWGVPTRLITDNIGGDISIDDPLRVGRGLAKWESLLRQFASHFSVVSSSRRTVAELTALANRTPPHLSALADAFCEVFVRVVTEMLGLTAAMSGPLAILRRLGTLAEHGARLQTPGARLYSDLDDVRTHATDADLRAFSERTPDPRRFSPALASAWSRYLGDHGHRGVFESDLARPRFREDPSPLLRALAAPPIAKPSRSLTLLGWLTTPLGWHTGRVVAAREEFRDGAMHAFETLRKRMLERAREWVESGVLPSPDATWQLTVAELHRLDEGWIPDDAFWRERHDALEREAALQLADHFHRFDDRSAAGSADTQARSLRGISLTTGVLAGHAWLPASPEATLPAGRRPEETILVAPSIDAGWVPLFRSAAAIVVETGGDLSHGSIILREIGLPSITNVHGATATIVDGEPLRIDAGTGVVERLSETA